MSIMAATMRSPASDFATTADSLVNHRARLVFTIALACSTMAGDDQRKTSRRTEDQVLLSEFNELAAVVMGTKLSDLLGGGRLEDGLMHDVATIKTDVAEIKRTNGTTTLKRRQRILLWVAAIGGPMGTIIAAVILTKPWES